MNLSAVPQPILSPLDGETPDHTIARLGGMLTAQAQLLNHCACLLAEAVYTDDGIKASQAEPAIKSIRGIMETLGKTTTEHYFDKLYARVCVTAGLRHDDEHDAMQVLDHIRTVLAAQQHNARYLEWTLGRLWREQEGQPARLAIEIDASNGRNEYREFPAGTTWMQALDQILSAPILAPAPEPFAA